LIIEALLSLPVLMILDIGIKGVESDTVISLVLYTELIKRVL
jgi:hypothetical protein